ncbi:MAG: hypothetical protein ACLQHS_01315 [Candidatus Limnocylindrales bacterium]
MNEALKRPTAVRIVWGETTREQLARCERNLEDLRSEFPEEPPDPNVDDDIFEYWESPGVVAWNRMRDLESQVVGLRDDLEQEGDRPARVDIVLRTEERSRRR